MISVLASKVVTFCSHSHKGSGTRLCPHQKAGENQDGDLRGEPGIPQRERHWRQSEALDTLLGWLLPVTGATRRILARIMDHFSQPDQAGQSLPRSAGKPLPWGGFPASTLPECCTATHTHTPPCSSPGQVQRAIAMWQVRGKKLLGLDYTNGILHKWSYSMANRYGKLGNNLVFSRRK